MLVDTVEKYTSALEWIGGSDLVFADLETTGLDFQTDVICSVGARARGRSFYFPFRHAQGANLPADRLPELGAAMHRRKVVGYNYLGFDLGMWEGEDVEEPAELEDLITLGYLIDENVSSKLEVRAELCGLKGAAGAEDELIRYIQHHFGGSKDTCKGNLWLCPSDVVAAYGTQDVESTEFLRDAYQPCLEDATTARLWPEWSEYLGCIRRMRTRGLRLDVDFVKRELERSRRNADEAEAQIHKLAGYSLNPRSVPQLRAWLGVDDTSGDFLEGLLKEGERADLRAIVDYRQWNAAATTYYQAFLDCMSPFGRLHPNLNALGTVSGRPSCNKPNLLNTPRNSDKYDIRSAFIADEGMTLIEFDYSQAEMRIGCHYGGVEDMAEAIAGGADIHGKVAKDLGIPRQRAKAVNFSFLFGIGPTTFSRTYHTTYAEAKQYLQNYAARYPGFRTLLYTAQHLGEQQGYIELWTGRRRHFTCGANTKDACNNLIQSSVAEMMRLALVAVEKALPEAELLLTVYDSMLLQVAERYVDDVIPIVKQIMEAQSHGWCSVDAKVDVKTGKRYGKMVEYVR